MVTISMEFRRLPEPAWWPLVKKIILLISLLACPILTKIARCDSSSHAISGKKAPTKFDSFSYDIISVPVKIDRLHVRIEKSSAGKVSEETAKNEMADSLGLICMSLIKSRDAFIAYALPRKNSLEANEKRIFEAFKSRPILTEQTPLADISNEALETLLLEHFKVFAKAANTPSAYHYQMELAEKLLRTPSMTSTDYDK